MRINKSFRFLTSCMAIFPILTVTLAYAHPEEWENYCVSKGGSVTPMTAAFQTNKGNIGGLTEKFCTFKRDNGYIAIGLSAFSSSQPNIAATYMKKLSEITSGSTLMEKGPGNPSYSVCKNLGGTAITYKFHGNFRGEEGGDADICVFEDGSMVSAWSLIYMANHRKGYDEVKESVRAEPLPMDVP